MSKFANALGVWELKVNGEMLELVPKMNHVRLFRNILVNDKIRNDKQVLFDKFGEFMFNLIKEHYPEEDPEQMKFWIEVHINTLFEEAMVAFKWTTKEQLEKSKT